MAKYVSENGLKAIRNWTKEQDYKSLYNLGAYDTISGNVITRQTGYYIFSGTETWTLYHNDFWYVEKISGLISNTLLLCSNGINVVCYNDNQIRVYLDKNPSITTSTDMNSVFANGVILQYKQSTSYTEEIIEGQPLITLDQQGSQWLRDEWEKGLNVFDGLIELGSLDTSTGQENQASNRWRSKNYISVKPNTTYTISGFSGGPLIEYNTNKTFIKSNVLSNNQTFTTSSTTYYLRFYSDSNNTDIMLNEGDHPYPYQAYNGEIVHDKDIADLYKQEYNLGYYDTMVENSDGTYTITRQTGYLVLDGVKHKFARDYGTGYNGMFGNYDLKDYALLPSSSDVVAEIICNRFRTYTGNAIYSSNIYGISITGDGTLAVGLTTAISTIDDANAYLVQNPISIQYKLATATTEIVEKNHYARYNERFILDHNKSEAERSFNLSYATKFKDTSFATDTCITLAPFDYKKGVTYTLSFDSQNKNTYVYIAYSTLGIPYQKVLLDGTRKSFIFTPTNDASNFALVINKYENDGKSTGTCSNVMLNVGSTPLPYQPYNQNKHITNNEAEFLKTEAERSANLTPYNLTSFPLNNSSRHLIAENLPSGTYTLSLNLNTYNAGSEYIVYVNDNSIGTYSNGTSATFTSNNYINSIKIYSNDAGATSAKVMLNEGSVALPYQPYNQNKHITNNEAEFLKNEHDRSANVLNTFDRSNIPTTSSLYNATLNSDGSYTSTATSDSRDGSYYNTDFRLYLKKGTYTFSASGTISSDTSCFMKIVDTNGNDLCYIAKSNNFKLSFTLTNDTNVGVQVKSYDSTNLKLMLNEGSVALPYQPYEGKVVHEKELENYRKNIYTTSLDANTIYNSSNYYGMSMTNTPTPYGNLLTYQYKQTATNIPNFAIQLFLDQSSNNGNPYMYMRGSTSGAYTSWKRLAFVSDIPTFKTINGNSIVGSGDLTVTADSVFTEVTDVIDSFTINKNGTWLITCLGYNKIYASDNSTISFYGSALVSMTSAGSDPHICINGTAYACSSAITFVTSGILQVYKKAN